MFKQGCKNLADLRLSQRKVLPKSVLILQFIEYFVDEGREECLTGSDSDDPSERIFERGRFLPSESL